MTFKVKGFRHTVLFPERHLNTKWFKSKLNYKKDPRNPCEQWLEEDFFTWCMKCSALLFYQPRTCYTWWFPDHIADPFEYNGSCFECGMSLRWHCCSQTLSSCDMSVECLCWSWLVLWWHFLNFVTRQMQCYFCYWHDTCLIAE